VPRPQPPDRKRSGARARGEHSVEIIRGVERLAREERLTVVLTECEASHTPRQEWLEGALSRKPDESSWSSPTWTRPNADSWRLAGLMRRHRRRRRTDARAPSERVSELDRWLRRHPPPATSSNSDTDASPSLVARHECGAAAHAPTATERHWKTPRSKSTRPSSGTATSMSRAATSSAMNSSDSRIAPRRSSRRATCRRSASTAPTANWTADPRGPVSRRLGRPARREADRSRADDDPTLIDMAGQATRLVLTLAHCECPTSTRIDLATSLVVRQSTAPIEAPLRAHASRMRPAAAARSGNNPRSAGYIRR
jgi:hypothetical protein